MKETRVHFESGYLLDSSFERVLANEKTIASLVPIIQEAWDSCGQKFVDATLQTIGREFKRSELLAYLIMHPDVFSCSHPFLININRFLPFDPNSIEQELELSELVYHELLHIYLDDNFRDLLDPNSSSGSRLLRKFAHEDEGVRAHLHLYAIQEKVFKSGGWPDVWDRIVENAKSLHSPSYKRALDLLADVGCDEFIAELK